MGRNGDLTTIDQRRASHVEHAIVTGSDQFIPIAVIIGGLKPLRWNPTHWRRRGQIASLIRSICVTIRGGNISHIPLASKIDRIPFEARELRHLGRANLRPGFDGGGIPAPALGQCGKGFIAFSQEGAPCFIGVFPRIKKILLRSLSCLAVRFEPSDDIRSVCEPLHDGLKDAELSVPPLLG